jgi:hypothetical protein
LAASPCRFSFEIDFQNFILVALRAFVFSHSLGPEPADALTADYAGCQG